MENARSVKLITACSVNMMKPMPAMCVILAGIWTLMKKAVFLMMNVQREMRLVPAQLMRSTTMVNVRNVWLIIV